MSSVLVILDGAPEPVQPWPTTLEAAQTPALDALCARGRVGRLRTTPDGLEPGSETGVPVLLGAEPSAQLGRGPIEAAAAGIEVPLGCSAWRLDIRHRGGRRAGERDVAAALPLLELFLPDHELHALRGHRVLAIGEQRPEHDRCGRFDIVVWPDGAELVPAIRATTTVVCAAGAAAGIARLLGARVVVPEGATGDIDTDLTAKAEAAIAALRSGDDVVVHVGGADEAAHRTERDAKRWFLEAVDAQLVGPLVTAARTAGATIAVTADHGTCPWTGRHDAAPVPFVVSGPDERAYGGRRLTERAVADAPVSAALFDAQGAAA